MDLLDEPWAIEFHSGIPVYRQIVNQLQAAIAAGRLTEGDQLPTIRALHQKLDVNPNTVAKAYRELALKGVVSAQQGSGCFVAAPAKVAGLSAREKKAKVSQLCDRLLAEAKGHGIAPSELVRLIQQNQSHV